MYNMPGMLLRKRNLIPLTDIIIDRYNTGVVKLSHPPNFVSAFRSRIKTQYLVDFLLDVQILFQKI